VVAIAARRRGLDVSCTTMSILAVNGLALEGVVIVAALVLLAILLRSA
jgi:hypothetical protein